MEYVLYTFESTSSAMVSEMAVTSKGIRARLVPLLPEIDAGCGLALRFERKFYKDVEEIFIEKNLAYQDRFVLFYKEDQRKPQVLKYDLL